MSKELERIRELTVSDEMLFPDAKSLTGVVERQSKQGFVVRATKAGKTVEYSAADSDGTPLQGKYMRMSDGAPHASAHEEHCFYCVHYGGAWFCTEFICLYRPT